MYGSETTDANGEGWVDFNQEGNKCLLIYIFQDSELMKSPCPRSDYTGSNVTCSLAGTSVYNNSCSSEILIQTLSADIRLQGTWVAVVYVPEREVTVVMVFDADGEKVDEVMVQPVQQLDPRILIPSSVQVIEEQFWFTVPGVTADPIAGLEARTVHPFESLLPLVEELDLWRWIERIKIRADGDNVPYPDFPPFGPTATPLPPTPIATVCGPPAGWVLYMVQGDDTLFSLASETRTSVDQIKLANCLVGDAIFNGQRLYLPFVPATPTPTPTPCGPPPNWVLYVVQDGDTLFSLASKTQATIFQIKLANCLVSDTIFEGQRLYLPFTPVTPTPTVPLVELLKIEAVEFRAMGSVGPLAELQHPQVLLEYEACSDPQDPRLPIHEIWTIFNKELHPKTVNGNSFLIEEFDDGQWHLYGGGAVTVESVDDRGVAVFRIFEGNFLPGRYRGSLFGDQDRPAITDLSGSRLDGEPHGLPSGDGIEGGNFVFEFQIRQCVLQTPTPIPTVDNNPPSEHESDIGSN